VNYVIDLINSQLEYGYEVNVLAPGMNDAINSKTFVGRKKTFQNIKYYEINNPSPISLYSGISTPDCLWRDFYKIDISGLLGKYNPDLIHIHTLFGLDVSFFQTIKNAGIPMLFTTHDYYGFCLKTNMINYLNEICVEKSSVACYKCNVNSPVVDFFKIKNNKIYFFLNRVRKGFGVDKSLFKKIDLCGGVGDKKVLSYESYHQRIRQVYDSIDYYHYNSFLSKKIYDNNIGARNGEVVGLLNKKIRDNRSFNDDMAKSKYLKFGFIGPSDFFKGLWLLLECVEELKNEYRDIRLIVWGNTLSVDSLSKKKYLTYRGFYDNNRIQEVYHDIDVLVVPSIWYETYGFVAHEAISFGVPVIVTKNVGMSYVVSKYGAGYICEPNKSSLLSSMRKFVVDENLIIDCKNNISKMPRDLFDFSSHCENMFRVYNNMLK